MKSRKKPHPAGKYTKRNLARDPQVMKWIKRLEGDPEATVAEADEDKLAFVYSEVLRRRSDDFQPDLFQQKMIETCPVVAAPDLTSPAEDLRHVFQQPEMQEFWRGWTAKEKTRGRKPDWAAAKAVLTTFGMGGISSHLDTVYNRLAQDPQIKAVFADLEGRPLERSPSQGAPPALLHYSRVCALLPRLATGDACRWKAMEANIRMIKKLRILHPNAGIGKRLLVDSSPIPAWVRQHSAGSKDDPDYADREAKLRRRTPEAGFRAYTYKGTKQDLDPNEKVAVGQKGEQSKFWRGYYLQVIADQATGLPLVWSLFDNSIQEPYVLPTLLSDLHKLWPDIEAELIAGDSIFCDNPTSRLCEVDYGIAPIFRLKPSEQKRTTPIPLEPKSSRSGTIISISYQGHLVCDPHRRKLPYDGYEVASREGLAPGKSSDEGTFRIRARCERGTQLRPRPCKRPGLRMNVSWQRLTRYPHHGDGRPELYAMRLAMLSRLNQVEGIFNRLKNGLMLGSGGGTRNRILDRGALEAAFSLGCLSMTALSLAHERLARGIDVGPIQTANQQSGAPAQVIQLPKRARKPKAVPAPAAAATAIATASAPANMPLTEKRSRKRLVPRGLGDR
jgi:hypothetical protein